MVLQVCEHNAARAVSPTCTRCQPVLVVEGVVPVWVPLNRIGMHTLERERHSFGRFTRTYITNP